MNAEEVIAAVEAICKHREEFEEIFKERLRVLNFNDWKYHDQRTYDRYIEVKMLYNKLTYLLDMCSSVDSIDIKTK